MYKYIVLCLCVSLSGVFCVYLNKEEGDKCEWEGLPGKCVPESSCLSTLDADSPKHPVCSRVLGVNIVCCTDCHFVNNTKNGVFTPSGILWKNGQKTRDICLQYLQDLPYKCKGDGDFYAGILRELDEEKKCYNYNHWDTNSGDDNEIRAEYPHTALLGYGEDLESATWFPVGSIISDKYILTAGFDIAIYDGPVKFIALDVKKLSDEPAAWQVHKVKRVIRHPEYDFPYLYNNIALIETENKITFNKNVLPACLHVEVADDDDETAIDTIRSKLKNQKDYTFIQPKLQGQPLLNTKQFYGCIDSIIGVAAKNREIGNFTPTIFTRVAPYIPWIESVVWP